MGLIAETTEVFEYLRYVYSSIPFAIRLLINGTFGGVIFLSILKSIRR